MIVDERLVTYINSLDRGNTPVLHEIEKEALRDFVPIIRKEMQSFLKTLLKMNKPKQILEVGTAIGFSVYRTQDCYQYLRFAIYFIRGIRGHPPNKMGFCTAKSVSCRGLA